MIYGIGVLVTSLKYRLWKWRLVKSRLFSDSGTYKIPGSYYKAHKPTSR
jgi:hypothetical protein